MPQIPCLSNDKHFVTNIRKQYSLKTMAILCIKMPPVFPSVFKKNVLEILQKCLCTLIKRESISLSGI